MPAGGAAALRCHEHEALGPVFAELTPLGPLGGERCAGSLEELAKAEGFRLEEGLSSGVLQKASRKLCSGT